MKKIKSTFYFLGTVLPMLISSCGNRKTPANTDASATATNQSFHSFSIPSLTGDSTISMADFKGKKILNLGPITGYLNFAAEERGGEVTSIDFESKPTLEIVKLNGGF